VQATPATAEVTTVPPTTVLATVPDLIFAPIVSPAPSLSTETPSATGTDQNASAQTTTAQTGASATATSETANRAGTPSAPSSSDQSSAVQSLLPASPSSTETNLTPANEVAVAAKPNLTLPKEADLTITLDIPQGVSTGSPYAAQLGILNIGNAPSGASTVNVVLPAGVQLDPAGMALLASSGCQAIDAQTLVCQIAPIAGGEGRRVQLPLINNGTLRRGADSVTVKVQGVSFERNLENNVARIAVLGFSASPVALALTGTNTSTMTMLALLLMGFGWALAVWARKDHAASN
jgi:hypothetical protein